MNVEIIYALPQEQTLLTLNVDDNCTVDQALRQSTIFETYPELTIETIQVGIFSEVVELNHVLKAGDRIEIYRPLEIDPMEARRLRAKK
jgi:putative ubiquitin-RnfH superfamily antitoxin RatB of RatAB toxin-antitoxin module